MAGGAGGHWHPRAPAGRQSSPGWQSAAARRCGQRPPGARWPAAIRCWPAPAHACAAPPAPPDSGWPLPGRCSAPTAPGRACRSSSAAPACCRCRAQPARARRPAAPKRPAPSPPAGATSTGRCPECAGPASRSESWQSFRPARPCWRACSTAHGAAAQIPGAALGVPGCAGGPCPGGASGFLHRQSEIGRSAPAAGTRLAAVRRHRPVRRCPGR